MGEVSLNEVGNAEQVLMRLLNERKVIEAAVEVLKTYRMVQGELPGLVEQHKMLLEQVNTVNNQLNGLIDEKARRLAEVEKAVEDFEAKGLRKAQEMIDKLDEVYRNKAGEYQKYIEELEKDCDDLVKEKLELEKEVKREREVLDDIKREHGVLAEALSRAAGHFSIRSG